jgi:hypothetical protein
MKDFRTFFGFKFRYQSFVKIRTVTPIISGVFGSIGFVSKHYDNGSGFMFFISLAIILGISCVFMWLWEPKKAKVTPRITIL